MANPIDVRNPDLIAALARQIIRLSRRNRGPKERIGWSLKRQAYEKGGKAGVGLQQKIAGIGPIYYLAVYG